MTYNKEYLLKLFEKVSFNIEFTELDADEFYLGLNDEIKDAFDFNYGASKFVLIPKNSDEYVIKIPFNGYLEDTWNEETYSGYEFTPFYCADNTDGWDYCLSEVKRYSQAEKEGLSTALAKTSLLCYIDSYPIYIQERCQVYSQLFDYSEKRHSKEENSKTLSLIEADKFFEINEDWLTDFRYYYGEEFFIKFMAFVDDNNWDDLRVDNIGYLNGRPVLIDYSSFGG